MPAIKGLLDLQHNDDDIEEGSSEPDSKKETKDSKHTESTPNIVSMTPGSPKKRKKLSSDTSDKTEVSSNTKIQSKTSQKSKKKEKNTTQKVSTDNQPSSRKSLNNDEENTITTKSSTDEEEQNQTKTTIKTNKKKTKKSKKQTSSDNQTDKEYSTDDAESTDHQASKKGNLDNVQLETTMDSTRVTVTKTQSGLTTSKTNTNSEDQLEPQHSTEELDKASRETTTNENTTETINSIPTSSENISSSSTSEVYALYDSDRSGLLNWDVATLQHLMDPDSSINNISMATFLAATNINYPNAMFCYDKKQMQPTEKFFNFFNDNKEKDFIKDRIEFFESKNNVCRLMEVSGKSSGTPHYQIVVFERKEKIVTLIEHTKYDTLNNDQISGIKQIMQTYGWGLKKNIKFYKSKGRGNNGDVTNKRCVWYYNHVYLKEGEKKDPRQPRPLCDRFACLVFLKVMSTLDSDFKPELMTFNEFDDRDMEQCFVEAFCDLLPKYIDNEMAAQTITPEEKINSFRKCEYTKQLLALPKDKFEAAINPPDGGNCFCANKTRKTSIYFVPSCCFRSYHYYCFIEKFMLQIDKDEDVYYCLECKQKDNVYLGIQNESVISEHGIHKWTKHKPVLFKQLLAFTQLDRWYK